MTHPQHPQPGSAELTTETISVAVRHINSSGGDLERAAKQIAEIGLAALDDMVRKYPPLKQLDRSRAIDYVSSSLVESLFEDAEAGADVVVQLDTGYLTVPVAYRDVLQSNIVRYLSQNDQALASTLEGGSR